MKAFYRTIFFVLATFAILPFFAHAAPELISIPDAVKGSYVFDGTIYSSVTDGETLYLGGGFTSISESTGKAVEYNALTEERNATFPKIEDGTVHASVPDGDGGWYIGGSFDTVADETRNNLVHITSNGDVDPNFNPDINGTVRALALSSDGSVLYVGGEFTVVNEDISRNYLAAFTTSDGVVVHRDTFNPNLDGSVYALALSSNEAVLYAGGSFGEVNGGDVTRNYLAAFSTTNGIATAFNPDVDGIVFTLAYSTIDGVVYAGGTFQGVNDGDEERVGLAAFDVTTGAVTAFNPDPNNFVYTSALSSDGSTLYVGGSFATIGGQARVQFAALDTATGLATDLDAGIPSGDDLTVYAVALSDDELTVYLGGDSALNGIGGQSRQYFGAISTETGLATTLNPKIVGNVQTISYSPQDTLFIGGNFSTLGAVARSEVAAIDLSTYELTDFDPDVVPHNNNTTYALELSSDGSILYIGGNIDGVNGGDAVRGFLAAVTTSDGLATAFDPDLNSPAYALALSSDDSTLYVGGSFDEVNAGDVGQSYLAAFDTATSEATGFLPTVDGVIYAVALSSDDSVVYATGDSNQVQSFDSTTGDALDLNLSLSNTGRALVLSSGDETLYVGGSFSTAAILVGQGFVFNETTDERLPEFPIITTELVDTVYASVSDGDGGWYVSGDFTDVGGEVTDGVAHILSNGSVDPAFLPTLDGAIGKALALSSDGETLYVGGTISTVNSGTSRLLVAAFDTSDGSVLAFNPHDTTLLTEVTALALSPDDGTIYVGSRGWESGSALLAFDAVTGDPASVFNTHGVVGGRVYSIELSNDGETLYVGGSFTEVDDGGTLRNRIAAFDTTTGEPTSFDPNADGDVRTLKLNGDESLLYVGGAFGSVGGQGWDQFAAIDPVTGLATSLDAQILGDPETVLAIELSGDESSIYIGGESFTAVGGQPRQYFAEIDADSGVATSLDFDLDGGVQTISAAGDGKIFVGGAFVSSNRTTTGKLFSIDLSDNALTSFAPVPNNTVRALALSSDDSLLYAGGDFTDVNSGTTRNYLAVFDTSTGDATDFAPSESDMTTAYTLTLAPEDDELYFGGEYGFFLVFDDEEVVVVEEEEEEDGGGSGSSHSRSGGGSGSGTTGRSSDLLTTLRTLITQFIAQGGTPTPAMLAFINAPTTSTGGYTRDLTLNDQGADVTALQNFLITQNKGPQAQALAVVGATGFFGPLTQSALAEFQASVGIVPASGYFGPKTRAVVEVML